MRITFVAAVGIAAVVILAILLIHYLANKQNRGPQQGPAQEPSGLL